MAGLGGDAGAKVDPVIVDERRDVDRVGIDACNFRQDFSADALDRDRITNRNEFRKAGNDEEGRADLGNSAGNAMRGLAQSGKRHQMIEPIEGRCE
jgi:hypothetical protein